MISRIRNYIFTGLLVVLPLTLSIVITLWLFKILTSWIFALLPHALLVHPLWRIVIRLMIPVVFLALLAMIGMVARIVFIRKIFSIGEKILIKIPLFNKIYIGVKQLSETLIPNGQTSYNRVVLVEFPRKGQYTLGFITSKEKCEVHKKTSEDIMNVFVPTTPNPTTGFLFFLSPKDFIELDMSVADGMKLVISGGTVTPRSLPRKAI